MLKSLARSGFIGLTLFSVLAFAKGPGQVTVTLDKAAVLNGVPIAAGLVILYGEYVEPSKRTLAQGVLSESYEANGIQLPKGSTISFDYNYETETLGKLSGFVPSAEMEIFQIPVASGKEVLLAGRVISLTLSKNFSVMGYPALAGTEFSFVCRNSPCLNSPDAMERLASLHLSKDLSINSILFPASSRLEFNRDTGALTILYLPKDQVFQGLPLSAGFTYEGKFYPNQVDLYSDGKISGGELTASVSFDRPKVSLNRGHFYLHPNNTVAGGILKESTVVNGIPLAAGWAHFDRYANVSSGELSEEATFSGYTLPKGTYFALNAVGNFQTVSFNNKLNLPVTFNSIRFESPTSAEFNKNGIVSKVLFRAPSKMGNLLLSQQVVFSSNGQPIYFSLAEEGVISGIRIRPYPASVSLFENGQLHTAPVVPGTRLKGMLVRTRLDGYDVSFHENGQPEWFGLVEAVTLDGVSIKANGGVGYYANGAINWLNPVAQNSYVQNIPAAEGSSVAYDELGTIKYVSTLFEDVTVNGTLFKAGGEYRKP